MRGCPDGDIVFVSGKKKDLSELIFTSVFHVSRNLKKASFENINDKRGVNSSDVNLAIATGSYCAGIGQSKLLELFWEADISAPTCNNFANMIKNLRMNAMHVSKEQLKKTGGSMF